MRCAECIEAEWVELEKRDPEFVARHMEWRSGWCTDPAQ